VKGENPRKVFAFDLMPYAAGPSYTLLLGLA
jgi:hypothetical protein